MGPGTRVLAAASTSTRVLAPFPAKGATHESKRGQLDFDQFFGPEFADQLEMLFLHRKGNVIFGYHIPHS